MASFFDKLKETALEAKEKAVEAGKQLGEMASDTVEITKLNSKISSEKGTIANLKKELGEYAYARFERGEMTNEEAIVICDKIKESFDKIAEFEKQIETIKAEKNVKPAEEACECCAEEKCCEEACCCEETCCCEEKAALETKVCPLCGAQIPADATVCEICGYEFKD